MTKLKKTKRQNKNPFYDDKEYESDIVGFARPRKTHSAKKDRYKNKYDREWNW
jgi:hypothetical protein